MNRKGHRPSDPACDWIRAAAAEYGAVTVRGVAKNLGWSPARVHYHVQLLVRDGVLERVRSAEDGRAVTYRLKGATP